ncbi:universal stress global response regulator UspA [Vibrio cincinnatiensis]|uniref:Universal stress protein n=1 Tax=Vibrio cincinnatiensis DSM 19608 TaxID=1123491 RepID=A0A1T4LJW8_VIBCI|nr:universal stress protein [Vibrio cincinnatiensis]MCG3722985.1 universal stress global response regulator UspA [Vibrio cincinnatiensis]MCG3726234.1 universal stress global response regulator UspA [Vibrio cincinnatiensis]MCG3734280.1 universal stress global response regulator UspA [Vibrio cincinnatiensis]MCG3737725.1 universal stress global response regulator UspA [Vibrio cincinnatiensis]MCG3741433.1 universal stress global response regulator UspA [Vibrio cincinnatiensis]
MTYQHILVALDLSDDSKLLIDKAISFAKLLNAEISLIHIDGAIGEIYPDLVDIQANPDHRPLTEHSNKRLRELQKYTDFPIKHFYVGTGDLSNKLEKTISDNGFDLLICGHHHDLVSRVLSYSRSLINHSPIDILVVPMP